MINEFNPLFYLNIMVIDDEPQFIKTFKSIAAMFNHPVTGTGDIQEATRLIKENYDKLNPFDVVFIDYLMPDLNGVEVAEKLKQIDPDLILIAMTRDKAIKTKIAIISSLAFRLLIPKDINLVKLEKLFSILVSTKIEQYSGDESRLSRILQNREQKAKQAKIVD